MFPHSFHSISPVFSIFANNLHHISQKGKEEGRRKKEEIWLSHGVLPNAMELPEKEAEMRRKKKKRVGREKKREKFGKEKK